MNKTYKIQLPRNKEAQNIRTNIKDGTIEVEVELKEKWGRGMGRYAIAAQKMQDGSSLSFMEIRAGRVL